MTASAKRACLLLTSLALGCSVPGPVLVTLLLAGEGPVADALGTAVFVLLVAGGTLATTSVVLWRSRREALRRGALGSATCSALVMGALVALRLAAAPTAVPVAQVAVLVASLVGHVVVVSLLPVTASRV